MITKYIKTSLLWSAGLFFFASCSPDTVDGDGNGITPIPVDASFRITKTAENKYQLKTVNNNYIFSWWNIDDDGFNTGKDTENIFLPDAGTYVIEHQAYGIGGQLPVLQARPLLYLLPILSQEI